MMEKGSILLGAGILALFIVVCAIFVSIRMNKPVEPSSQKETAAVGDISVPAKAIFYNR